MIDIYLKEIETRLQEKFPGMEVHVWIEESANFPHDYDLVAKVGNYGIRLMYLAGMNDVGNFNERYFSDILEANFKDIMDEEDE